MSDLSELGLQTSYHKGRDDIAEEFYLPCMRRAIALDRAVGFFRSTVFVIAWPALRDFVNRDSRIRVLCSQVLSAEDIQALGKDTRPASMRRYRRTVPGRGAERYSRTRS